MDPEGNNFRRAIHSQSFIALAFIFSELDRGGFRNSFPHPPPVKKVEKKPGLDRVNIEEQWIADLINAVRLPNRG